MVATRSRDESLSAYQRLGASTRKQLRAELVLAGELIAILDAQNALRVLDDLDLPRAAAMQLAGQARPGDHAFLREVLHLVRIDSIANITAAAGDLLANPAYLPMLDRIINAKGVTAKQQLALATSSSGIALLERIYPGLSPLRVLPALGADPAAQRDGYTRSGTFGRWLFTDPSAIEEQIKLGTDGPEWARAMWAGEHQGILLGWIASDQAYWGNAFGHALLKPDADDAAALRALRPVAAAIFGAIAGAMTVEVLIQVFVALRMLLPEWINALGDAGRLDMKSLQLALDGPNVGPHEQDVLAGDDEAIARIRQLTPGKRPSQVLTQLPSDPVRFCTAVGRGGAFSRWVTEKTDVLAAEMLTVVNWNAWMMAFQQLNDPLLFLSAAANPALQDGLRLAMQKTDGWAWLLKTVPHPIPTQAQVDVVFKLFKDGSGIKVQDKHAMWDAIYRTPLKRKGDEDVAKWTNPGEVGEKRFIGVDPNDQAMNLFFQQYSQMPRTHVDTANAVVFCNVYTIKKTIDVPGPGGKTTKQTDFYDDNNKITTTPEQKMGTSFYWGYTNSLYMKATDASGNVDTRINTDDFVGKAGEAPGAVNRSKAGLAAPDMTFFQNHATHEVGHAVGNRQLTRGKYAVKGNDFCRDYGQWKEAGSQLDYARMLGFSSSLDGKTYEIEKPGAGGIPSKLLRYTGAQIRTFLTGIVEGGLASQASHKIATDLGSPEEALDRIRGISDLGATVLVKTVNENKGSFPGAGWQFPHGINGEQNTVTMFAGGKWQQYHASIYNHRVSSYSTYSVGENFAEMYTARYTNGKVPPPIGGLDIGDFFNELTKAEPSELGLAAAPPAKASPGAEAPATEVATGGGAERVGS